MLFMKPLMLHPLFNSFLSSLLGYEKQVAELSNVILKKTKFTKEEVERNMNGDWYVSAEDCVKHGVYDKIITSIFEIIGDEELVTK